MQREPGEEDLQDEGEEEASEHEALPSVEDEDGPDDPLLQARRADSGMRRFGPRRRPLVLLVLGIVLAVFFGVDLWLTGGLVGGAPYVLVVVASAWAGRVRTSLVLGAVCTLLIVVAQVLEDATGGPWEVWERRVLAIGLVWLATALVVLLLRAHRRFELALEASPTAVLLTDPEGDILLANRRAERLFGYPQGGLVGRNVSVLVPPRQRSRFAAARRAYFSEGSPSEGESRELVVQRHDGSELPVEIALYPLRSERGVVLYTAIHDLTGRRRLEREKDRLAALVQTSSDAIVGVDVQGVVTSWNAGAETLYGRTANEMFGLPLWMIAPPHREREVRRIVESVARGARVRQLETEHVARDGRRLRVALSASPVRDGSGDIRGVAMIARDVTEQKRAEALLLEMNLALANAMPGHAYVDASGRVTMANEALRELFGAGLDAGRSAERPSWMLGFAEEAVEALETAYETMLKDGKAEATVRFGREAPRYADVLLVRRSGPGAQFQGHHLFLREVTDRVRAEERLRELAQELERSNDDLERLAQVDPLTGLMNRRGLERFLLAESRRARRDGTNLVAILVDLDDFKAFNEVHGHHGGDRVLAEVAERIRHVSRVYDGAARIGGDEFLLVLPSTRLAEARLVAERLRTIVSGEPVRIPGPDGGTRPVTVTCSLGLAEVPGENPSIAALLVRTREALRHSKAGGKDRVSARGEEGDDLEVQLLRVLDEGLVDIAQQPIFDLREDTVVAYELLCRGPAGPLATPADFFALAAANEMLERADLVCLRHAVTAARLLPGGRRLHLNLFPQTLRAQGIDAALTILAELPADRRVCIELNEQAFVGDPAALLREVEALRAAGHQLALDDVGFGKSALETLIVLEPEIVKLDRRVVVGASKDPVRQRVLDRMLGVVHGLRAMPIAEGIEDADDRAFLLDLGVRYAQGYHLERPRLLLASGNGQKELKPFRPEAPESLVGRDDAGEPSR